MLTPSMEVAGDPPSVSGTLIHGLIAAANEVLGPQVVARGFELAPREASEVVRASLPVQWVPIDQAEAAFGGIARAAGRDWGSLHGELAVISVERATKTFWRLLLRLTTDEALVSRTPVIFTKSYNRGRLVPRVTAPGRSEVEILDWPELPEWPIRGVKAGIETVLRLSGRKNVRIEGGRSPAGAKYIATWG